MADAYSVGIIGGGAMGSSVAQGLVTSGLYDASSVYVCDHHQEKLDALQRSVGVVCTGDADELFALQPDAVILAIKPQVLLNFVQEHVAQLAQSLVISIAAGLPLSSFEERLVGVRVVRVMPNLPISVRSGASAIALGAHATDEDAERVVEMFSALGSAQIMREDQLDVCGQSVGCSPALFALMVDTLTRAAVRCGMPAAVARDMFENSMLGTAQLLLASGEHPREFMERVCSPGGTTIQFLKELEPKLVEGCENGLNAALARNKELGGK